MKQRLNNPEILLNAVMITGAGGAYAKTPSDNGSGDFTFQCFLSNTTGAGAVVYVQASLDDIHYDTLITFTLSGAGDSATRTLPYISGVQYLRGYVYSITGVSAAVTLRVGV